MRSREREQEREAVPAALVNVGRVSAGLEEASILACE